MRVWSKRSRVNSIMRPRSTIAVGREIAPRPCTGSQRAELPHWGPTLGEWRQSGGLGTGACSGLWALILSSTM